MSIFLLPICYVLRNGMTVDDLGLILAGGAVALLMIRATCHALRVLATRLIVPAADLYLNVLVGGVPARPGLEFGVAADIEDLAALFPDDRLADPDEDNLM